jgi:hypothetical protein
MIKVGDRVRTKPEADKYESGRYKGLGTVMKINNYDEGISVEFDEEFDDGHNCSGKCEDGYGWHFGPDWANYLEIVQTVKEESVSFEDYLKSKNRGY